jgi:lantibiotic biosynthesis protein
VGDGCATRPIARTTVVRTFAPGSEWGYLKLYAGHAAADRLLRDALAPLARALSTTGASDRWFFLRYADPEPHLRIRFHGEPAAVRDGLQALAARALETGLAHDAQLGTYNREIERYGGPEGILVAEQIFHADSDAVLELLEMFEPGAPGLAERWQIGALGTELLLRDLGLGAAARVRLARRVQTTLEHRLGADARLKKAVAGRVREHRDTLEAVLGAAASADPQHPLAPGIGALSRRTERIRPLGAQLTVLRCARRLDRRIDELASSYAHMWLNRLCRSQNTLHECVTYALLAAVLRRADARARGDDSRARGVVRP